MPRHSVPSGAERQTLFDELSAVFTRCSEQASAIDLDRATALAAIPDAQALLVTRDAAARDAERRADAASEAADRAFAAATQAADRDFFDAAQALDAKRQHAAIDADRKRDTAIQDAKDAFERTIRAIHRAVAGLQAMADAEKRARDERDQAIREADHDFRDAIEQADSDRQAALDAALTRQIAAHRAADDARTHTLLETQTAMADAIGAADRVLDADLAAIPAARQILHEASRRREELDRSCGAQKRAIEARLRGDD